MTTETLVRFPIELSQRRLDELRAAIPRANGQMVSATKAVEAAIGIAIDHRKACFVAESDRTKIASLAGMDRVPENSHEMLKAFERAAHLGPDMALVELDPGVSVQLQQQADSLGWGFSEIIKQVVEQSTLNDFAAMNVAEHILLFDDPNWKRLLKDLGVPKIAKGGDLVQLVIKLVEVSTAAVEEVKRLRKTTDSARMPAEPRESECQSSNTPAHDVALP